MAGGARRTDVAEHGPFLAPAAPSGSRSAWRNRGFGGGLGRGARRGGARVRPDERRGRLERSNQPEVDALLRGGVARGLAVRAPPVQRPLADHAPLRTFRLAHENLTSGGRAPGRSPVGAGRRPRPLRHGAHGSRRNAAGRGKADLRHLRPVPLLEPCRDWTSRRVTNPRLPINKRRRESRTRGCQSRHNLSHHTGCCWLSVGEETGAVSATAARKRLVHLSRKARFDARSTRVRLVGHVAARSLAPHHVGAHDPGVSGTSPSPPFPVARHPDVADASSPNVDPSPVPLRPSELRDRAHGRVRVFVSQIRHDVDAGRLGADRDQPGARLHLRARVRGVPVLRDRPALGPRRRAPSLPDRPREPRAIRPSMFQHPPPVVFDASRRRRRVRVRRPRRPRRRAVLPRAPLRRRAKTAATTRDGTPSSTSGSTGASRSGRGSNTCGDGPTRPRAANASSSFDTKTRSPTSRGRCDESRRSSA